LVEKNGGAEDHHILHIVDLERIENNVEPWGGAQITSRRSAPPSMPFREGASKLTILTIHLDHRNRVILLQISICQVQEEQGAPYCRNKNMGHSRGGKVEDIHEDDL
jgi:hypothetical protein